MEFPDERVVQLSDMATSKVENWSIWSNTSRKKSISSDGKGRMEREYGRTVTPATCTPSRSSLLLLCLFGVSSSHIMAALRAFG